MQTTASCCFVREAGNVGKDKKFKESIVFVNEIKQKFIVKFY